MGYSGETPQPGAFILGPGMCAGCSKSKGSGRMKWEEVMVVAAMVTINMFLPADEKILLGSEDHQHPPAHPERASWPSLDP